MQNIILSYPNRIDAATITGGSWLSTLPAQNLANRELWKVARSTDASLASTKFSVDLGEDRLLRCLALANHNLGPEARWLVKVFNHESLVNIATFSEDFSGATWLKTRSSVSSNCTTAPDGTITGDKLTEDTSASIDHYVSNSATGETNAIYTISVYIKPAERSIVLLNLMAYGASTNRVQAIFNLSTKLVTYTNDAGDAIYLSSSITLDDNGWYRIALSGTPSASGLGIRLEYNITTVIDGNTSSYTGDGVSGLYMWGLQVVAGADLGLYKPTTSAPSNIALLYSSQWQDVWQIAFDNLVEWESSVWWTGTAGDEYYRSPYSAMLAMPDFVTGRYITVEIDDTANPDGYVQTGRLFAGGGIQPATNASYGLQDSWRDLSTMDASESGSAWATERRRLRGVSFVIDHLTLSEAAYIHEMQRLLGTVNEVLYLPFPDDLGESQRYGFIGRLSELSAIEYPYFNSRSSAFKIEEIG